MTARIYTGDPTEIERDYVDGVYVRVNRIRYTMHGWAEDEERTGVIVDHELDQNGNILVKQDDGPCYNHVNPKHVIDQWVDGTYVDNKA